MLDFIIKLVTIIFTEFIHILCYQKLTGKSYKVNIKNIVVLTIFSFLTLINNKYTPVMLKTMCSFVIMCFIMKFWFNLSWKENIKKCLIISAFSIAIEISLLKFIGMVFTDFEMLNLEVIPKVSYTIILGCLLYFLFSLKSFVPMINKIIKFNLEYLLLFVAILLNALLIYYNQNYAIYSIGINIIIAIIVSLLFFITLRTVYKYRIEKLKISDLNDKVNQYEKISDDYRELKHNLNYDLLAIRSVSNKRGQKIVDQVIQKYNRNYGWISKLENVPTGLQGIIYIKLRELQKDTLCVEVNNKVEDNVLNNISAKNYYQLCEIMGNVIDNAIQGALTSVDQVIYISIEEKTEESKELLIKVINTFSCSVDLDEIGKKNYSTKKLKSGIGLNYLNRFKNIKIKKEIFNNLFIISISVPEEK